MRVRLDRPADGLLTRRVEFLSGSFRCPDGPVALTAACAERPLPLRPCVPAPEATRPGTRGFWAVLVLQDWVDVAHDGLLRIDFFWNGRHVADQTLVVSPVAADLTRRFPLLCERHPVPRPARPCDVVTVVFPGLGAVGGSSLGEVFRLEAHRRGFGIPVHHEADHPDVWARYDLDAHAPMRWIDGHRCFAAGARLPMESARVTLLRDPLRRLASVFSYNSVVHPDQFPFRRFESFLESGQARRYSQAEGLLRLAGTLRPERLSDSDLVRAAREELSASYAFVGLTEKFEESLFTVCRMAGIDSVPVWYPVLSAPRRVDMGRLPARLRRALDAAVAADRELYEWARDSFERRLSSHDFGSSLEAYRAAAQRQPELSDVHKTFECLRWRQVMMEVRLLVEAHERGESL